MINAEQVIKDGQQFVMDPCPFCAGPPCVSVKVGVELDDCSFWDAHVWCHDCGAQGPHSCDVEVDDADGFDKATAQLEAINAWNIRGYAAIGCYERDHCTVVFDEFGDAVQVRRLEGASQ